MIAARAPPAILLPNRIVLLWAGYGTPQRVLATHPIAIRSSNSNASIRAGPGMTQIASVRCLATQGSLFWSIQLQPLISSAAVVCCMTALLLGTHSSSIARMVRYSTDGPRRHRYALQAATAMGPAPHNRAVQPNVSLTGAFNGGSNVRGQPI